MCTSRGERWRGLEMRRLLLLQLKHSAQDLLRGGLVRGNGGVHVQFLWFFSFLLRGGILY